MKNQILIYNDYGTNDISSLTRSLEDYFIHDNIRISTVGADDIIKNNCLSDNVLAFFMPGGRATPYFEKLKTLGNDKIREYVYNGGIYFGICAGAYYASRKVFFETDVKELSIIQECELNLIDANAVGTLHKELSIAPYSNDFNSIAAAKIRWCDDNELHTICYHGGPYFELASDTHLKILAEYELNDKTLPAVVMQKHHKGLAIASGLHFEDSGKSLRLALNSQNISQKTEKMLTDLEVNEPSRQALIHKMMQKIRHL